MMNRPNNKRGNNDIRAVNSANLGSTTTAGLSGYSNERVKSNMEIISCYFMDVLYNKQYNLACEEYNKGGGKVSKTDIYVNNIMSYLSAVQNGGYYGQIIKAISGYYMCHTSLSIKSEYDVLNIVLQQFIPYDYYCSLNSPTKQYFIEKILYDIISAICRIFCREKNLRRIIDDHMNKHNIPILKESVINELLVLRDSYYDLFVNQLIESKTGNGLSGQNAKTVSRDMYDELKVKHDALLAQNHNYAEAMEKLKSLLLEKTEKLDKTKMAFKKVVEQLGNEQESHEALRADNERLIGNINSLKSQVKSLEADLEHERATMRELASIKNARQAHAVDEEGPKNGSELTGQNNEGEASEETIVEPSKDLVQDEIDEANDGREPANESGTIISTLCDNNLANEPDQGKSAKNGEEQTEPDSAEEYEYSDEDSYSFEFVDDEDYS